ncbi:gluconate 2-dehydrogenase subunit 3 family protein [Pseudomonas sp. LS1212]|uniref:gluconate 2-dehydrogenase subunit 3 family protein n=1 Tax=Pseudomonas sp. LS1212 TaxID=2972478 RepID=UPI00215D4CCC|nr:gluconate 2-dehydrogenase subunit 3 family protein [Pseudomonas sp. LS1212]UVJ46369.1 gluconate 2-dehydrogenase subunit 3 family protein [Pseudomonas sp. LS1212]
MHDSPSLNAGLSRRRFIFLSGQSLLLLGASAATSQLIPVTLLADEALPSLPQGLLRMGRDIYPHDRLSDLYYAKPLAELLGKQPKLIDSGLNDLQARAQQRYGKPYDAITTEDDRVALLREIETGQFFHDVRSALMFGIYDNKALFQLFGYEGSSVEKGGYLMRGYNDLDWL